MEYEGAVYRVNMMVKEYDGERRMELEGVKKLYDLKLDKKIPGQGFAVRPGEQGAQPKSGISGLTIRRLLEGVKEEALLPKLAGDLDAKAVAHADRVVRLTQGSGKTSDLSAIQRGGELQKTVTTFFSWFNVMYNLASLTQGEVVRAESNRSIQLCYYPRKGVDEARKSQTNRDDKFNKSKVSQGFSFLAKLH